MCIPHTIVLFFKRLLEFITLILADNPLFLSFLYNFIHWRPLTIQYKEDPTVWIWLFLYAQCSSKFGFSFAFPGYWQMNERPDQTQTHFFGKVMNGGTFFHQGQGMVISDFLSFLFICNVHIHYFAGMAKWWYSTISFQLLFGMLFIKTHFPTSCYAYLLV